MMTLNVQFVDSTQAAIDSCFGCPQNPDVWANLGQVTTDDARWAAFYNALSPSAREHLPAPNS